MKLVTLSFRAVLAVVFSLAALALVAGGGGLAQPATPSGVGEKTTGAVAPVPAETSPPVTPPAAAEPAAAALPSEVPEMLAYVDLCRARAVADGAILFGTDSLHRHLLRKMRSWGTQGRDGAGYGYSEVRSRVAYVRVVTQGDERRLELTGRAVGRTRALRVMWDGRVIGDWALPGAWTTASFPLDGEEVGAGRHKLELRRRSSGAAVPAGADERFGEGTEYLLHDARFLTVAGGETEGETTTAPSGPRDADGILWLRPGERARFLFPLVQGTELFASGLRTRGEVSAKVRVSVTLEGEAARDLGEIMDGEGRIAIPFGDAGRLTQLDLVAVGSGRGEIGIEGPVLRAPRPAAPEGVPAWTPPKNVIVMVIDTWRGDRLSAINPDSPVKTPHLDAFAAEGVLFTRAIVQGNYSKETACSLFTSTYNDLHHCHKMAHKLPRNIPGMQERFHDAGYKTAALIANGYVSRRWGYGRGWDAWHNYITTRGRLRGVAYDDTAFDWGREPGVRGVRGECVTRDAVEWLRSVEGSPSFLYVQTIDPHTPYRPPRKFWEPFIPFEVGRRLPLNPNNTGTYADGFNAGTYRFRGKGWEFFKALYLGEVAYTDHYFGKMIDALRARGVLDETMIVVTADHGEGFQDHATVGHGILNLYEEVIRVPLIVRYPGGLPAGRRIDYPVEQMDIAPTVMEAAGLEPPPEWQGASLLSSMREADPLLPPAAFSTMSDFLVAVRVGRFKLVRWRDKDRPPEIYDVVADPGERHALASSRPLLLRYLSAYADWYERVSTSWKRAEKGAIGDFRPR